MKIINEIMEETVMESEPAEVSRPASHQGVAYAWETVTTALVSWAFIAK